MLAALARGRGYAWSATSGEPTAFWAAIAPHLPTPVAGERGGVRAHRGGHPVGGAAW
ncbi:hypothetical protein [Amycolatopsis thermoflava]|uniref:hypothetical protein n=1 Tax=Amycolatopsis thermoflava TaxID=84480 RepID=UPI003D70E98E